MSVRRGGVLALALAIVSGLAVSSIAFGADRGRLRGEVRSATDGERLERAQISAVRVEAPPVVALTTTDELGMLRFDRLPSGTYLVSARPPGHLGASLADVRVRGPFRAVADLRAEPGHEPPGLVQLPAAEGPAVADVFVVDAARRPMSGVLVELRPVRHRANPTRARTGEDGRAQLGPVEPGTWRLTIAKAGFARLVVPKMGWPGGELRVVARLLPLGADAPPPLEDLLPNARLLEPESY